VRPHERTFQAVKDERLGLMLACNANLSPIFAVYADDERSVDAVLRAGRESRPIISFTDTEGMAHRVWRGTDALALRTAAVSMKERAIFIADGHHRYETALAYRNLQRSRFPEASPLASFNYVMMYLSDMNQGGLTILPTHRLLRGLGSWDPERFLLEAESYFRITRYDASDSGKKRWREDLEQEDSGDQAVIGFYWEHSDAFYLLEGKSGRIGSCLSELRIPQILQKLVVVVLDHIVLRKLMGLSDAFLADEKNIHFEHAFEKALHGVQSGGFDAVFLIKSTRMEHVQEVASAGLTMPHKSTYFFPKAGSGIVVHALSPVEEVVL
jgi:uncharacterized protein (DUF1015 family)